jgi:hypothetical protein
MNPTRRNLFIGSAIILGPLLFSLYNYLEEKPVDNCKSSVRSALVLVIDRTGPLAEATLNSIQEFVDIAILNAEAHTAVSVYYIQKDSLATRPDFHACIPPKRTVATALTQDEEKVQHAWDKFRQEFLAYLRKNAITSQQSAIYETIADIARDRKTVRDPARTQFMIFSDFVQYSKIVDLYSNCTNPEANFRKITQAIAFDASDRPLSEIRIERFFIPRENRSRDFTQCIKNTSDMVLNRLGMGTNQSFVYLSRSPAD